MRFLLPDKAIVFKQLKNACSTTEAESPLVCMALSYRTYNIIFFLRFPEKSLFLSLSLYLSLSRHVPVYFASLFIFQFNLWQEEETNHHKMILIEKITC